MIRALNATYADITRATYYRSMVHQIGIEGDGVFEDGSKVSKMDLMQLQVESSNVTAAAIHQRLSPMPDADLAPTETHERASRVIRSGKAEVKGFHMWN